MRVIDIKRVAAVTGVAGALVAGGLAVDVSTAPAAEATAKTCAVVVGGWMCTTVVDGWPNVTSDGLYVDAIVSERHAVGAVMDGGLPGQVCNYSAWFFAMQPDNSADGIGDPISLGYESRADCGFGDVWLRLDDVDRTFPAGTLICSKWFEDADTTNHVGQRCVGLSA